MKTRVLRRRRPWRPLTESDKANIESGETIPAQIAPEVAPEVAPQVVPKVAPQAAPLPAGLSQAAEEAEKVESNPEKGYEDTSAIPVMAETDPTEFSATQPTQVSANLAGASSAGSSQLAKAGAIQSPPKHLRKRSSEVPEKGCRGFSFRCLVQRSYFLCCCSALLGVMKRGSVNVNKQSGLKLPWLPRSSSSLDCRIWGRVHTLAPASVLNM